MRMEVDTPLPLMTEGRTIGPEDFVDHVALPHIIFLLEQNWRLAAQKEHEWQRETRL
jgi:hypothetical protein